MHDNKCEVILWRDNVLGMCHCEKRALAARLAEAERDAQRYAWIRNMCEVTCLGVPIESDADVDVYLAQATASSASGVQK